jgi:3-methyladenine DNA glycosylase AlkD
MAARRPNQTKPTVAEIVKSLQAMASKSVRDGMARYAIPADKAFGISVGSLQAFAKKLGLSHDLALGLWKTGWYEARLLACMLDEPDRVTPKQMDEWCKDFDSWAICDTACFKLFDQTPHAFTKFRQWAKRKPEFEKRAAFALLASLALHDKETGDERFTECLPLVEAASVDDRNFVKKGVSWALRGIGRRSRALHSLSVAVARRLAAAGEAASRWIGKDALRELTGPVVLRQLAKK